MNQLLTLQDNKEKKMLPGLKLILKLIFKCINIYFRDKKSKEYYNKK